MIVDVSKKILIVGLGLLGGSYARALKRFGFHISAITLEQESIDYALKENIIDEGSCELDEKIIGEADLVIFALYPHVFVEWIQKNQGLLKSGALITDVTGVKGGVVERIQQLLPEGVEFISAHPMAGRELTGSSRRDVYDAASPEMFRDANYLVVPTEKNTPEAIRLCEQLGHLLGFARVTRLSVEEHDRMIAYLSQLTHAIAVSLMCCAGEQNGEEKQEKTSLARLALLTGDSFRDLTRIAKINDVMWSELFLANRQALLEQMDVFIKQFTTMREALANGDSETMRQMMRTSTDRRRGFDQEKK